MKTLLILFAIGFFALNCSAQTGEEQLYIQLKQTNKELNKIYNKLNSKLTNSKDKAALIESQKAWLKYRDAHCKFTSKEESEGGVIANKVKLSCQIELTKEHIAIIKDLLTEF